MSFIVYNGELISLIGINELEFSRQNQNCLRPIPSFDMMSKFPGSDHSCRRRYVAKLLAERINKNKNNNKNKEISRSGLLLPVEYLQKR